MIMVLSYAASSASLVIANLAQLVTFSILARSFGAVEFGHYVAFSAVMAVAVYICGLGASECMVRRVAQDRSAYTSLLGHNLILIFSSGVILVLAGMLIMPTLIPIASGSRANLGATFLMLCTNIILMRLLLLVESAHLGHANFGAANRSVLIFAFVRTATAAVACLSFGVNTIAEWAIWQFSSFVLLTIFFACRTSRLGWPRLTFLKDEIRLGILFATPFLFRAVRQNADLMVLGIVASPEIAASYGVARKITDASYMAIDALNRLVYTDLAAASVHGIHHAIHRTQKILVAALVLGILAALAIFIAAPYLPLFFGSEYTSLVKFCQIMCWCITIIAVWSVAVDLLGAASLHGPRAWVLNLSNGLGAVLIAVATWFAPPEGTFISNYLIEIVILIAAWSVLFRLVARARRMDKFPVKGWDNA